MTMSDKPDDLNTDLQTPEPDGIDKVYSILKATVAGVPVVGGSANELLSLIFKSPFEKRAQKWREEVSQVINYLVNNQGLTVEELQDNEQFVSAVANASQIASRNHQQEKLDALKNALINTAMSETIEDSLQNQFLNYIDFLTVWHLKILGVFHNPQPKKDSGRHQSLSSSPSGFLEDSLPELRGKREMYDLIWKDLYSRGLVNIEHLHVMMTAGGVYTKRTTAIGNMFIEFISHPDS